VTSPESWRAKAKVARQDHQRSHVAMGTVIYVLSALLAVTAANEAWILILIGEGVAALLLYRAFRGDSITPVVSVMLACSGLSVFADEQLQFGSVLSAVLAVVVGEILAEHRAVAEAADLRLAADDVVPRIVTPGLVAAAAAGAALLLGEIDGSGRWALAAAAALAVIALVAHRRSSDIPNVPLPPPPLRAHR